VLLYELTCSRAFVNITNLKEKKKKRKTIFRIKEKKKKKKRNNDLADLPSHDSKGDQSGTLQEIPQLIIVYEICYNLPPGGNNLHYIYYGVLTSLHWVTRV